ncbi:MAG: hypothetical protein NTW20_18230 [Rhodobacterales bacterium]|nr:hypothetical protein [Rhodobacterales bacterium]
MLRAHNSMQRHLFAVILLVSVVAGPVASVADDQKIQTTDSAISGKFEVAASFDVVSRGERVAPAKADEGHLYLGDRAMLTVKYKGARQFGDRANSRCLLQDIPPTGVTNEKDCTPKQVPFGSMGMQGEYSIGFTALATDPSGLWRLSVEFEDESTGDVVVVEVRFWVHTELES